MNKLIDDWRVYVLRPTLAEMAAGAEGKNISGLNSPAAEALLLGTAITESNCAALVQYGGGPAMGFLQMEPATFVDVREYLARRLVLFDIARPFTHCNFEDPGELIWNLKLQVVFARLFYWRFAEPLPAPDDILGLARYWKKYYNSSLGDGRPATFSRKLRRFNAR